MIAAIQAQNVIAPVGRIGARPISNDQQFQLNIQTQGRLTTPEQFGNIVLRANPDGSLLRIKDVARVELGAQNQDIEARFNGKPAVAIGIYLTPGANAVTTAKLVRANMARLSQRFPPGLKYLVNYDTTTFVFDTIHDVLITLLIAFILVVIVVFLFLGSLRATIIPAIAVPVSVIGSFAVLLAMGYSANTISLLAMVLAIGILVDDAIVVVENVERVMEEEPELSPADATKKAMAQITGPIIAITLVLFSVFVPIAFIPGVSGTLFRQFAVTISVAMAISALNALTLSPALCAVFLRHGGPKRGIMGWVLRRIDNVRDGYAAIVVRLVRVSFLGVVAILAAAAAIYALQARVPTGFLPEEDQEAFFVSVQLPDGASVTRSSEAAKRIEALLHSMPQVENVAAIVGFSIIDGVNEPNAAFIVPTLKPFADRVGAANSAQALIGRVFGAGSGDPGCDRDPVQPAADHRAVDNRRLRIRARRPRRPGTGGDEQRHAGAARRRQPRSAAHPRVFDLHGQQSVDFPEHRPAEGAGARPQHERRVHDAAGHARQLLRQQLQSVRTGLAGQYRGRAGRPAGYFVAVADLYPQQIRHRRTVGRDRPRRHYRRAPGHHPLQQLPGDPDTGKPGARRFIRHRTRGDGRSLGEDLARGLQLRMVRHGLSGTGRGRADWGDPRPCDPVCVSVFGRALRKLDDPGPGLAVGTGRRAWARLSVSCSSGCRSTFTPRSGLSC